MGALRAGGGGRDEREAGAGVMRGGQRDNTGDVANRWTDGWHRLTRIWRADTAANVDDELRFHFEQKVEEFVAAGASASDARARAEAEFGDVQSVRESLRTIDGRVEKRQRRAEWWEGAAQDLKYVLRTLRRSPAFTITVVVTLALGLGANAALFSVLDQLYVQTPAGVTNALQLRRVYQYMPNGGRSFTRRGLSFPEIRALREVAPAGLAFAAFRNERGKVGRTRDGQEIGITSIEGNYFGLAGVQPELGRFFSEDESRIEGISMVAVISDALWARLYNRDPAIVGKEIELGTHRHVIIGVAGGKFRGTDIDAADMWIPLNSSGTLKGRNPAWYEDKNNNGIQVITRVTDEGAVGVFNARATDALHRVRISRDTLTRTFLASIIEARAGESYDKELAISTRLGGVAAVILLIACANVVNLLLARAASRQREIAVRLALGISRRRLLMQLLIESGVLAFLSAGLALVVAFVAANTLRALLLPGVHWSEGAINTRVAAFTAVLAVATGFLAGLVPALQASRPDLSKSLKTSVRDGGQRGTRLRSSLLVAQAALSVVLLVGAGVFVQSLRTVESIDLGYDTTQLMFASIGFDRELDNRSKEIAQNLPELARQIRGIPGVEKVALAGNIPMYGFSFGDLHLPGRDSLPGTRDRFLSVVSPQYFATTGTRVLKGREFTDYDGANGEKVMAVDENLAREFWPGEDALTKCLIVGKPDTECRRIVAVVATTHFSGVIEGPSSHYYVPMAQAGDDWQSGVIVIRASSNKIGAVSATAARQISQTLGDWSRPRMSTMEEIIAPNMRPWRVGASLFTSAGLLALLVAAVGVYSSVSYTISQRKQEMGVRVALGATSSNIIRLVVSDGVRVVALGVALGILVALALGSIVATMLYNTSPRDPFVLVASTATLLVVAVISCAIPAWRASRADPLSAMRAE